MPLSWADVKCLARLNGIANELLESARNSGDPEIADAVERQLGAVGHEVHGLLADTEPPMAEEFHQVVLGNPGGPLPPEVRAASMAGWLNAALAVESLEEKARQDAQVASPPTRWRKQTIGFKIRAPISRAENESGSS